MPQFDSDQNMSAAQERPGLRELLHNLTTPRKRVIAFTEKMPH